MSKNAEKKAFKPIWIIISFIVLITILLLPTPNDLPIMAKCALNGFCRHYVGYRSSTYQYQL